MSVGVERADAQGALSHRGPPPPSRRTRRSGAPRARRRGLQAGRARLGLERGGVEAVEADRRRSLVVRSPERVDDLAQALDGDADALVAQRDRPAASTACRRPRAGRAAGARSRSSVDAVAARRRCASARTPPGRRWARARAQEPAPALGPPSSCTVCIGTMIRPKRPPPRSKPRASAGDRLDRERPRRPPGRAARRAARRRRRARRRRGRGGQVERDAAGARRRCRATGPSPARVGQLAPQRQVLGVAAALEVVPDARSAASSTRTTPRPRRGPTSTSRSASIAVYVGQREQRARSPSPAARVERPRRGPARPTRRSVVDAGVLEAQRHLGGAGAAARHAAHAAGEHLEVGVPDPADVAAVGDVVVEDAEQVVLAGLERRACAAPRWRRRGS